MERLTSSPEFPELEFEERKHIYLLNGEQIPSVSQIMEPLNKAKYDGINKDVLNRAADRGTAIHNAIENYIKFGFTDIPSEFKGYMDAFLDWYEITKPVVVGSEIRMYHKLLKYAGTCDLLCYIGDDLTLVDYKSTYSVSEMTCGVQLEGYSQALGSHGIAVARKQILQVKNDGKHKVYGFQSPDALRWRVFGACKIVYDYTHAA